MTDREYLELAAKACGMTPPPAAPSFVLRLKLEGT